MDIWHISYLDLSLRLVAALLLGGLIGLERELSNHAAGLRTHILVCTGSAVIMLLSIYGFGEFANEANVRMDPARLAAQVISGIGFLGAGAIIRNGVSVSGLTTAASIWVVAAIGLCVGAGFYYCAILVALLVLISLFLLNIVENRMMNKGGQTIVTIKLSETYGALGEIPEIFEQQGLRIRKITFDGDPEPYGKAGEAVRVMRIQLYRPNRGKLLQTVESFQVRQGVISLETS